jgi:RNA polymerase sigma-70 factor (ECF subfamily)
MDPEEIRAELESLHPDCFGWALCCCGWNREEAEDVLQDAYLSVLDGRASFGGRARFKTWLFGVIRRTAWSGRRGLARRLRLLGGWRLRDALAGAAPADPAEVAEAEGVAALLRAELRRLPRRQREVLHLVFYEELSIEESAEVLGIGLGTARTHYERGKRALRARLGGERTP